MTHEKWKVFLNCSSCLFLCVGVNEHVVAIENWLKLYFELDNFWVKLSCQLIFVSLVRHSIVATKMRTWCKDRMNVCHLLILNSHRACVFFCKLATFLLYTTDKFIHAIIIIVIWWDMLWLKKRENHFYYCVCTLHVHVCVTTLSFPMLSAATKTNLAQYILVPILTHIIMHDVYESINRIFMVH